MEADNEPRENPQTPICPVPRRFTPAGDAAQPPQILLSATRGVNASTIGHIESILDARINRLRLYASGAMESHGDYRIDIERRATGAPKFRVTVLIDEKNVGTDYAATAQQADHLAKRMIQRHQELHRQLRGF